MGLRAEGAPVRLAGVHPETRHSRERGNPCSRDRWIPAFAGMTTNSVRPLPNTLFQDAHDLKDSRGAGGHLHQTESGAH